MQNMYTVNYYIDHKHYVNQKNCKSQSLRKSIRIRSYSGLYFFAFGLNMERYEHFLRSEFLLNFSYKLLKDLINPAVFF